MRRTADLSAAATCLGTVPVRPHLCSPELLATASSPGHGSYAVSLTFCRVFPPLEGMENRPGAGAHSTLNGYARLPADRKAQKWQGQGGGNQGEDEGRERERKRLEEDSHDSTRDMRALI